MRGLPLSTGPSFPVQKKRGDIQNVASHFDRQLNKASRREHNPVQLFPSPGRWHKIIHSFLRGPVSQPSRHRPAQEPLPTVRRLLMAARLKHLASPSYTVFSPSKARIKEKHAKAWTPGNGAMAKHADKHGYPTELFGVHALACLGIPKAAGLGPSATASSQCHNSEGGAVRLMVVVERKIPPGTVTFLKRDDDFGEFLLVARKRFNGRVMEAQRRIIVAVVIKVSGHLEP